MGYLFNGKIPSMGSCKPSNYWISLDHFTKYRLWSVAMQKIISVLFFSKWVSSVCMLILPVLGEADSHSTCFEALSPSFQNTRKLLLQIHILWNLVDKFQQHMFYSSLYSLSKHHKIFLNLQFFLDTPPLERRRE